MGSVKKMLDALMKLDKAVKAVQKAAEKDPETLESPLVVKAIRDNGQALQGLLIKGLLKGGEAKTLREPSDQPSFKFTGIRPG